MKISELKQLEKGSKVRISEGNGWYHEATFVRTADVISFGKFTFTDLMEWDFDMKDGRKKTEVVVEFVDEHGRKHTKYVDPRSVKEVIA